VHEVPVRVHDDMTFLTMPLRLFSGEGGAMRGGTWFDRCGVAPWLDLKTPDEMEDF